MKYKRLTVDAVRYIIVHCSATPADMDIGSKEIDRWHRERGYFQIGYHAVIRRNGLVEAGRPIEMPGAHARGYNEISLGVCLVGGIEKLPDGKADPNYTREQLVALRRVLEEWKALCPNAEIIGHRDIWSPHDRLKECPSFDVKPWVAAGMPDFIAPQYDNVLPTVTVTAPRE